MVLDTVFPMFETISSEYEGATVMTPRVMAAAAAFPRMVNTLEPVSSTWRLEPTESVLSGFKFATPTFEVVTILLPLSVAFVTSKKPVGEYIGI